METILVLLGLAVAQPLNTVTGTCHHPHREPTRCIMQEHRFGQRYVTDGQAVYGLRPIWFGGIYSVNKDHMHLRTDTCSVKDRDLVCLKTVVFISDK